MWKLRALSVMAVACILGLSLLGLATSQANAARSSSVVVLDASTELALLGAGELEVFSVTCTKCISDNQDCFQSNCGIATPNCCCKWCNGSIDCRPKSLPGVCIAD